MFGVIEPPFCLSLNNLCVSYNNAVPEIANPMGNVFLKGKICMSKLGCQFFAVAPL